MDLTPFYEKYGKERVDEAVRYLTYRNVPELPKTELPNTPTLYVFRHGQSEDNLNMIFSGWRDVGLTEEGIKQADTFHLPNGLEIKIFSVPYLLASKIEAFHGRGKKDFLMSPDIEDILILIDGCLELKEKIAQSPTNVKGHIKKQISDLLKKKEFIECVHAHIESANPTTGRQRAERALIILKEIINNTQ